MKKLLILISILLLSVSSVSAIMPDSAYAVSIIEQKFAWLASFGIFQGGITGSSITGATVSQITTVNTKCAVCTFYETGASVTLTRDDAQQFESFGLLGTCDYTGCFSRSALTGGAVLRTIGRPGNYKRSIIYKLG